jgi:hypothetical protein
MRGVPIEDLDLRETVLTCSSFLNQRATTVTTASQQPGGDHRSNERVCPDQARSTDTTFNREALDICLKSNICSLDLPKLLNRLNMRGRDLLTVLTVYRGVTGWEFPRHDTTFPAGAQVSLGVDDDDVDIVTGSQFYGLRTYADLPYVNCFSDEEAEGHKYDIAIMGAPHDTVSFFGSIAFLHMV